VGTTYTVNQGDCLSSIAYHYGLASWEVIYDDPNNADFRALRPDPNLIYPGDQVYIPDIKPRSESVPTDQQHVFVASFPPTYLNVRIKDQDDQPVTGAQYEMKLDAITLTGATDDDGWIRSKIPAWSELGTLKVWPNPDDPDTTIEWQVGLGHLDPIETVSGIKERLTNLGYNCGEINDVEDDTYTAALMQFQTDYNLKVDGIVGPQTRGALVKEHQV
jgi:N-acetylmuramoyl-L-alanine amidase